MPLSLPEKVNPLLFCSIDGRYSTEAEVALAAAQSVVANGRSIEDNSLIGRSVMILMLHVHSLKWPLPLLFPLLGWLAGCFDRGVFCGGFRRRISGWMLRFVYNRIENRLLRVAGENVPGWNEYHMAIWFITGSEETLAELHERATFPARCPQQHMVRNKARVMVDAVRAQYPDFDFAMTALETRLNAPIEGGNANPATWPADLV